MVANYLTDERDLVPMIAGIRLMRRIFATAPFAAHFRDEVLPGKGYQSDEELTEYLRANAQSMYHPVGTCRMGADADAVVDQRLRVRGIGGLRVADASVMPRISSGNTNAPTLMIAEKAADLIVEDRINDGRPTPLMLKTALPSGFDSIRASNEATSAVPTGRSRRTWRHPAPQPSAPRRRLWWHAHCKYCPRHTVH